MSNSVELAIMRYKKQYKQHYNFVIDAAADFLRNLESTDMFPQVNEEKLKPILRGIITGFTDGFATTIDGFNEILEPADSTIELWGPYLAATSALRKVNITDEFVLDATRNFAQTLYNANQRYNQNDLMSMEYYSIYAFAEGTCKGLEYLEELANNNIKDTPEVIAMNEMLDSQMNLSIRTCLWQNEQLLQKIAANSNVPFDVVYDKTYNIMRQRTDEFMTANFRTLSGINEYMTDFDAMTFTYVNGLIAGLIDKQLFEGVTTTNLDMLPKHDGAETTLERATQKVLQYIIQCLDDDIDGVLADIGTTVSKQTITNFLISDIMLNCVDASEEIPPPGELCWSILITGYCEGRR